MMRLSLSKRNWVSSGFSRKRRCVGAVNVGASSRTIQCQGDASVARIARTLCIATILTFLTAVAQAETAVIEWNPNPVGDGVTAYNVYFDQGAGFTRVGVVSAAAPLKYNLVGVSPGTTYKVYLTATNSKGDSQPSTTLTFVVPVQPPPTTVPTPPQGLRATIIP